MNLVALRIVSDGNSENIVTAYLHKNDNVKVEDIERILKYEEGRNDMTGKLMTMKERVENTLGKFMDRNKNYAVHAYIRNFINGNFITRIVVPADRTINLEEKKYILRWKSGDVECNDLSLLYEEILDCYEKNCEENGIKIAEMVIATLKNGMKVEFECCGDRM